MKKVFTIIGIVCLIVSVGLYMAPEKTYKVSEGNMNECKNFNSKDYFLTGGTQKPMNMREINIEMNRLYWLCNGGSNNG